MQRPGPDAIGCFCHIPKTAGTTVEVLLRRHFGLRHLDVHPRKGVVCDEQDLQTALRMRPGVVSISSHGLRPFVDYGRIESRLVWYTVLRDPIARIISNYQHHVEKKGAELGFIDFMNLPENRNWHVRMLSGGQDLDLAKENLAAKVHCFGVLERFNEFMLLLRSRMGWTGMRVAYGRPKNPARKGDVAKHIKDNFDQYRDATIEANALDRALYDYAMTELYPKQIADYGEARLQADLVSEFADETPTLGEKMREFGNDTFRKYVYRPVVLLRKRQ